MEPRFALFAVASAALHLGILLGPGAPARLRGHAVDASGGSATGTGGTAAVAGETFDVPELETPPEESTANEVLEIDREPVGAAVATAESASVPDGPASAEPAPAASLARRGAKARKGGVASAVAPPPPPPLYGAVGDRAAGDLVIAFKRQFATAASSDPLWNTIPVGFSAAGDVTFVLAPDGTLSHYGVNAGVAPAFRAALERTFAMLKHRVFTAKGETTRLHMVVRVTDQLTNHGAFTIDAQGSFELPSGRRVAVQLTER